MTAIPAVDLAARVLELVTVKRNADKATAAVRAPLDQCSALDRVFFIANRAARLAASTQLTGIAARAGGVVKAEDVEVYVTADGLDTAIYDPTGRWWPAPTADHEGHMAGVRQSAASGAAAYWRRQRAEGAAK
jgi:hypothetical protein